MGRGLIGAIRESLADELFPMPPSAECCRSQPNMRPLAAERISVWGIPDQAAFETGERAAYQGNVGASWLTGRVCRLPQRRSRRTST